MSTAEEKITVLLADDHPVTREGIRKTLEQAADICVIGEAGDGIETEKLVSVSHRFDPWWVYQRNSGVNGFDRSR